MPVLSAFRLMNVSSGKLTHSHIRLQNIQPALQPVHHVHDARAIASCGNRYTQPTRTFCALILPVSGRLSGTVIQPDWVPRRRTQASPTYILTVESSDGIRFGPVSLRAQLRRDCPVHDAPGVGAIRDLGNVVGDLLGVGRGWWCCRRWRTPGCPSAGTAGRGGSRGCCARRSGSGSRRSLGILVVVPLQIDVGDQFHVLGFSGLSRRGVPPAPRGRILQSFAFDAWAKCTIAYAWGRMQTQAYPVCHREERSDVAISLLHEQPMSRRDCRVSLAITVWQKLSYA